MYRNRIDFIEFIIPMDSKFQRISDFNGFSVSKTEIWNPLESGII
jgi:hypothetical protein